MTRRSMFIAGGIVLVASIALGVAVVTAGDVEDALAYGPVDVQGDSLPRFDPESPDPAAGMDAPGLSGIGWEEAPVAFEPGGEPAIVLFLAHWCPHCQAEVPRLQAWLDEGAAPDGVRLFSVATSSSKLQVNFPPSDWLEEEGWTPPVLFDDQQGSAAAAYGVSSFPFWAVIDGTGRVALRYTGELDRAGLEQIWSLAAGLGG